MFTILDQQKRPVQAGQLELPFNGNAELDSCQAQSITSLKLVEQINFFRLDKEKKNPIRHDSLLNIIRDEFEEEIVSQKLLECDYEGENNRKYPMFNLSLSQAKQVLVRESKIVRKAMIQYIEKLESAVEPAPVYRKPETMSKLDWINYAMRQEEEYLSTQQELKEQKLLVTSRESTIDKLNDRNIETFNLKATQSRTGLKSIKNDLGFEINFLVNRIFANITSYPVRHRYARDRYNSTDPKAKYIGATYASLDSKIEYKNWLLSLQRFDHELPSLVQEQDFEELLLN
jgi:hypothetical protein